MNESIELFHQFILEYLAEYTLNRGANYWEHPVTHLPQDIRFDAFRIEMRGDDHVVVVEFHDEMRPSHRYAYPFELEQVGQLDDPRHTAQFIAAGILTEIDERIEAAHVGGLPIKSDPPDMIWLER